MLSSVKIIRFDGGLNTKVVDSYIADNEASDLLNIEFHPQGIIEKRKGYIQYFPTIPTNKPVMGLYEYILKDGRSYIICYTGGSLWTYDYDHHCWIRLYSNLSTDALGEFDTYNNHCLFTNGENEPMLINFEDNFVTTMPVGTPPDDWRPKTAKFVKVHKNRTFFAGDLIEKDGSLHPSRIRFSEIGTPPYKGESKWPLDYYIDISGAIGVTGEKTMEHITGLAVAFDALVIFTHHSIYLLIGDSPDNFILRRVNSPVGTISHRSIVSTRYGLFFVSDRGVHLLTGIATEIATAFDNIRTDILSYEIEPTFKAKCFTRCCAVEKNERYWISCGSGYYNDCILMLDFTRGIDQPSRIWSVWDNIYANALVKTKENVIISGDSRIGNIYRHEVGYTDNGQPIRAYYKTKNFDFGFPFNWKVFRKLIIGGSGGDVSGKTAVTVIADGTKITNVLDLVAREVRWDEVNWDDFFWDDAEVRGQQQFFMNLQGRRIQYLFTNENPDESLGINQLEQYFRILSPRL